MQPPALPEEAASPVAAEDPEKLPLAQNEATPEAPTPQVISAVTAPDLEQPAASTEAEAGSSDQDGTLPEATAEITEAPAPALSSEKEGDTGSEKGEDEIPGFPANGDAPNINVTAEAPEAEAVSEAAAAMPPAEPGTEEHEEHLPEQEETDYATHSKAQLAGELKRVLLLEDAMKRGRQITELHRLFHQRLDAEREEARQRFLETGGEADAFEYRATSEDQAVDQLVDQFREKRVRHARQQEEVKVHNLQRKREILERLRQMVDASETKETVR